MASIEEINELWAKDAVITDDMFEENRKIPRLHQKYFHMLVSEGLRLKAEKAKLTELTKDKTEYFRGQMDIAEIRQRGWPPLGMKVLKEDVIIHIESDKDVIEQSLKVGLIDTKVKYLEDIIRQIHSRNFILKAMMDWKKFEAGV